MLSLDRKQICLLHPVRLNWKNKKHKNSEDEEEISRWLNQSFIDMTEQNLNNLDRHWYGIPFEFNITTDDTKFAPLINLSKNIYLQTRLAYIRMFGNQVNNDDVFEMVKGTLKPLTLTDSFDEEEFKLKLEEYYEAGQKELVRELKGEFNIKNYENTLIENGFKQYQTEKDMISFILQCKKGLSLIEIEYFKYDIPKSVRENIIKADNLKVFDNFYILYTDPKVSEMKVESGVKKDPIVFGVIVGSDKLYYIDDWMSDYCKLTYKDILKTNKDTRL